MKYAGLRPTGSGYPVQQSVRGEKREDMTEEKVFRLGSLFDGSGGFPLAGVMHGIVPVWASEIEPFAIRVTKLRFPNMKHLGSVTDVDGAKVEPVDIITFGSPCQDLSVAGKQLGIHDGQRSNLFFEAIRIIKEMRDATSDKFPRFAVWENVPGAFSSNKGEDFRAVLRAFAEIGEKGNEVSVPFPEKGKWLPAGTVVGNGWSLAWRVYDAQFWGVPQRRKRIYLIADFGSERAGEILFKPESVSGHPEPGGEKGKGTSGDAEGSARGSYSAVNITPGAFMGGQGAKARSIAYCDDGSTPTIKSAPSGGNTVPDVVYPINTMVATRGGKDDMRTCFGVGEKNDPQFTLSAAHEHGVCYANGCDLYNGQLTGEIAPTLGANSCTSANHAGPSVCYTMQGNIVDRSAKQDGICISKDISPCLNTQDRHAVAYGIDQQGRKTLCTKYHYGSGGDAAMAVYNVENHPADSRIDLLGGGETSADIDQPDGNRRRQRTHDIGGQG